MIGMKKDEVLQPFTKTPLSFESDVSCHVIPSAGILLCNDHVSRKKQIASIIVSILVIIFIGLLFSFTITLSVGETTYESQSLYTLSPVIPVISIFFGYFMGISRCRT